MELLKEGCGSTGFPGQGTSVDLAHRVGDASADLALV